MIDRVKWQDEQLYCTAHVAWVRCLWKEQTYLSHPAWWCPACRDFVASDALPEEAKRESASPFDEGASIGRQK